MVDSSDPLFRRPQPSEDLARLRRDEELRALISHLYELALNPFEYERFVDVWDSAVHANWPDEPPSSPKDVDATLSAHVGRADQFLDRLPMDGRDPAHFDSILSLLNARPAFVLGQELEVLAATAVARDELGLVPGLPLPPLGQDRSEVRQFRNSLLDGLAGNGQGRSILRLQPAPGVNPMLFHTTRRTLGEGGAALLVVGAGFEWRAGMTETLRSAFDLTDAESNVARLLAEGFSAKEIARRRGASPETVRKQLRALYAKTASRSRAEVVRSVLSVAEIAAFTEDRSQHRMAATAGRLPALPFHRAVSPDGRQIEYLLLGDPAGRPLLFLTLDYGLVRLPAAAEAEAARRGWRIVTPVPAGYGNSEPMGDRADYAATSAADILTVLDAEGVAACPILASQNTYHAVNVIAAARHRFTALVQAPATFPLSSRRDYQRMHKWHRFVNGAARFTPGFLPFAVKAGFHLARRLGKRGFLHAVYGGSPGDLRTIADPEAIEAMIVGSEVALSARNSAHRALSRQIIALATENWAVKLQALEGHLPVKALQGLDDPYCPPATLAEQRSRYPWIDLTAYDDVGELLLFTRWRDAFDAIAAYV